MATPSAERLYQLVTQNGSRLTPARKVIIDCLVDCHGHITADDLAELVHVQDSRVGRMTVYRTLDLLCELGSLRPIYQGTGAAHYVILSGGSHHHLICSRCHTVIEFDDCPVHEMTSVLSERFHFQPHSHLLEIYGVCETCNSK